MQPDQSLQLGPMIWTLVEVRLLLFTALCMHARSAHTPAGAGCMCDSCNRLRCRHPAKNGVASSLLGAREARDSCTARRQAVQHKDSCSSVHVSSCDSKASPRKGNLSNRSLWLSSTHRASPGASTAIPEFVAGMLLSVYHDACNRLMSRMNKM